MHEPNHAYRRLEYPDAPALLERLSSVLHDIYQDEALRQSQQNADTVRHPDAYEDLPEHTKDYDRALAIFILEEIAVPSLVELALDEFAAANEV